MSKLKDLTGQRFGRLVAIKRIAQHKRGTHWECSCDCGGLAVIITASLTAGRTVSCGCAKTDIGELFKKRPYEALYNLLMRGAKNNLEHTLTYEEFVGFTKTKRCHYCGEMVSWTEYNIHYNGTRYNLDRKDNLKGYSKANCVVCCKRCNLSKSYSFTYKQWKIIGQAIKANPKAFKETTCK